MLSGILLLSHSAIPDSFQVACQAPLSMEFSWQEYQSRLPLPPPGDLPNPGIEPTSLVPPALAGVFFTAEPSYILFSFLEQISL